MVTATHGISATNRQFETAFARGDAAGCAAIYTEDAKIMPPAHRFVVPVMLGVALLAALLVGSLWMTLGVLGVVYIASLPLSWLSYRRRAARMAAEPEAEPEAAEPEAAPIDDPGPAQP